MCEDFVTENTELIPAWRILKTQKKDNSTSVYQHFVNCCESLGIKGAVPFLDRMIVLDYIIANEDRHLNNFGVIRNAETLEWLGFAPIYDSGSSLGYDKTPGQIRSGKEVVCKPFKNHHAEQLKPVSYTHLFIRAADGAEFAKQVALLRSKSLYDTGVTPVYGQQLLTLSTCYGSGKDGRLIVAAAQL